MRKIISNTSCLIILDNIGMLFILKELYGNIWITEEVYHEFEKKVDDWVEVKKVKDQKYLKLMNSFVDLGEASTIALSIENENSVMILDDLKARKLARKLELTFTGTIGVLLKARENKIINSLNEVVKKLKMHGFRISEKLEEEILESD